MKSRVAVRGRTEAPEDPRVQVLHQRHGQLRVHSRLRLVRRRAARLRPAQHLAAVSRQVVLVVSQRALVHAHTQVRRLVRSVHRLLLERHRHNVREIVVQWPSAHRRCWWRWRKGGIFS